MIIETVKRLEGIQAKRNFLSNYAAETHAMRTLAGGLGVNELLTTEYQREGAGELRTFQQWRAAGRQVKRGAKSLILYSAPLKKKGTDEELVTHKGNKLFGIAHVFSENDTEPVQQHENAHFEHAQVLEEIEI